MSHRSKIFIAIALPLLHGLAACGTSEGGAEPPSGSCRTGGSATGSFQEACNTCGQQRCDAELRNKSGSGYAQQYFGGDGACAAYNGCLCTCYGSGSDPIACATTTCLADLDSACQQAVQDANDCLQQNCATECR